MTLEQWLAVKNRDAAYDGRLFWGLRTARIVCRPSCGARSRNVKNVVVFDALEDALRAGYRPCSRCRPELERWEGTKRERIRLAEAFIRTHYTEKFSLDALAGQLHVDRCYLLRTFKEVTGLTPLQYHNRVRCDAARELLTRPELSVAYIAGAVGYASASHFAQVFRRIVGRAPSKYRSDYLEGLDAEAGPR